PQSGEFPPDRNANHESRLETGMGKTGRFRGEIRPAERRDGRLVEEGKTDAGGDRANFEGALEHSTAAELSGVPSMKHHRMRTLGGTFRGAHAISRAAFGDSPSAPASLHCENGISERSTKSARESSALPK